MGGGASQEFVAEYRRATLEEKLSAGAPVHFATLHADGRVEHRGAYHDRHNPAEGRIGNAQKNPALEAQAAAHWNRMIEFAVKQQAEGVTKPPCPECSRGNHLGPKCRICGTVVTVPVASGKDTLNKSTNRASQEIFRSEEDKVEEESNDVNSGRKDNDMYGRLTTLGDKDHDAETNRRVVAMLLGASKRKPNSTAAISKGQNKRVDGGPQTKQSGGSTGMKGDGNTKGRYRRSTGTNEAGDYETLLEVGR
jgi:hypothetical protein